jgi:FkbM family methyltransferase
MMVYSWVYNYHNWASFLRAFLIFVNPLKFVLFIIRRKAPANVRVRTPTGVVNVSLRNFESLKTLFSIFCRRDYLTNVDGQFYFIDIGANIGVAALYFLSRNKGNGVVCYEPDPANLPFLKQNLDVFGARATIEPCGVGVHQGNAVLYRSLDGKYSSLNRSDLAAYPEQVSLRAFKDILQTQPAGTRPVVIKLDVEGIEVDLVKCVAFEDYPDVRRLVCESLECSRWVTRPHTRIVRSGYVEDLLFLD